MAPNLSGVDVIDQPRSMYLAELALDMAAARLEAGRARPDQGVSGRRVRRAGAGRPADVSGRVKLLKPEASRSRSPEMYLLAMQFRLV